MRGNAVDEVLCHQAGCEDPAIGLHALRKFDLALTELDRKQRLYGAICFPGHRISLVIAIVRRSLNCGTAAPRWEDGTQEQHMAISLRHGLIVVWALVSGAVLPADSPAQDYPKRPITVIVPFAVGGLTDVPVRVLTGMLQERIGQTIVVENKPGGSGTLGGAYAARAAPDGYTLFANSIADAQNLYFLPVPYSAIDDFAMIGMVVEGPPLVLIIDAELPYRLLRELLADAKTYPNKISFGTSGPATSPAMALAQLNALAKTEIAGVPYAGSGEAARNVSGGGVQGAFAFYAQAKPLADDNKVKALAAATPQRIP